MRSESFDLQGARGRLFVHHWPNPEPDYMVLIAHGLGEHAGRYGHVAERLLADGAEVFAPDHVGRGRSEGERAFVDDLHARIRGEHFSEKIYAGARHEVFNETNADEVMDDVVSFLSRTLSRTPS